MQIIDYLQTLSKRSIIALGILLLAAVGSLDYLTGSELSFSVFYLLPIVIVTWFVNRRAGILASIAGALIWMIIERLGGRVYTIAAIPYWNAGVRLSFFLIVTFTLSALRSARLQQEELGHFVVHDLRSPVANVLSGLQYLVEVGSDADIDERNQIMRMSMASCNRALTLINSLLDLARLESGKMELKIRETDVSDLFDSAMQQVEALSARSDVKVATQVDDAAKIILVDSEITMRVLVNLTSNALKYSPRGSTIVVAAKPYDGDKVAISVADKGAGIPPEWKDRVFDKFSQVEARKKGLGVGTGLGLSFCRLAVEAQHGRIWLESEVGQGTTVIFTAARAPKTSQ